MEPTTDRHTLDRWFEQLSERPDPDRGSKRELAYTIIRSSHAYLQSLALVADDEYGVMLAPQQASETQSHASQENVRLTVMLRSVQRAKEESLSPHYRGETLPAERLLVVLAQAYTLLQAIDEEGIPELVLREEELVEEFNRPGVVEWITRSALLSDRDGDGEPEWEPISIITD